MSNECFSPPTPEQVAKIERQRQAAEDAAQALKDAADKSVAVRENMARLRELRLAKEATDVHAKIPSANATPNLKVRSRPKNRM